VYRGKYKGNQCFFFAMPHENGDDAQMYKHPFITPGKTYDEVIEDVKMLCAELLTTHTPKKLWSLFPRTIVAFNRRKIVNEQFDLSCCLISTNIFRTCCDRSSGERRPKPRYCRMADGIAPCNINQRLASSPSR
jgi:hypothetical protein